MSEWLTMKIVKLDVHEQLSYFKSHGVIDSKNMYTVNQNL